MIDLIEYLGTWNWWILGIVLLCVELVAPGTFILWFGVAALAVGILSLFVDWGWQLQVVTFGVIAIASVAVSRLMLRRTPAEGDTPFLNQRGEALIGRRFVLRDPIVSGRGRIVVDDSVWRVAGPDLPAGTRVTVVSAQGTHLVVAADSGP